MPKVSRFSPNPQHMGVFIDNFWNAITLVDDKDQVKTFLGELLTHTEITMFAKRIQIAKMLTEGEDYQTIIKIVRVTPGTISQVNNTLHTRGQGLRNVVKKLSNYEQQRKKQLEAKYNKVVPAGPYRLVPDLLEAGVHLAAREMKRSRRRASVKVEPVK